VTDPSGRFPFTYLPLEYIMVKLGHRQAILDVLKMDIEHSEWDVFEKHIFKVICVINYSEHFKFAFFNSKPDKDLLSD